MPRSSTITSRGTHVAPLILSSRFFCFEIDDRHSGGRALKKPGRRATSSQTLQLCLAGNVHFQYHAKRQNRSPNHTMYIACFRPICVHCVEVSTDSRVSFFFAYILSLMSDAEKARTQESRRKRFNEVVHVEESKWPKMNKGSVATTTTTPSPRSDSIFCLPPMWGDKSVKTPIGNV